VNNHGKGIWILNGLAIRTAQSLGVHRDGTRLGLSPFESELRRRLWWHLLSRDSRASEDYGLENTSDLLLRTEISLPLNLDDTDLYPEMEKLPPAKRGWTMMTFSLVNISLAKAMQRLAVEIASSSPPSEDVRVQVVNETTAHIEEQLRYCNPIIPQQRQTLSCAQFVLRKFVFISRFQWASSRRTSPRTDFATTENLMEALDILKPRLSDDAGLLKEYDWARKAYPQYHVMLYVLWHLCVKPAGPETERAWEAVHIITSRELSNESAVGFGSKLAVLAALKAKALSIKAKAPDGISEGDTRELELDPFGDGFISSYLLGDIGSDALGFDADINDWSSLTTYFN
jgi:hypothetical protein